MLFSATPFPGHAVKLDWRREDAGGNWYFCAEFGMEGWLCPALFHYFNEAPRELYVRAESISGQKQSAGDKFIAELIALEPEDGAFSKTMPVKTKSR